MTTTFTFTEATCQYKWRHLVKGIDYSYLLLLVSLAPCPMPPCRTSATHSLLPSVNWLSVCLRVPRF